MKTQKKRRRSNVDILGYVYTELEIKENYQNFLHDEWVISDIRKIRNILEDYFKVMRGAYEK